MVHSVRLYSTWMIIKSHKDPEVVTEVLSQITGHFGELIISRGAKHDFLGINIKLRKDGLVEVEQQKRNRGSLSTFWSV